MRHRYIYCGIVHSTDPISNFRLIYSCTQFSLGQIIRVNIPDDMTLYKHISCSYQFTYDNRTLEQLGFNCYIVYDGKWVKADILKSHIPSHWDHVLKETYGIRWVGDGYSKSKEKFKYYREHPSEFPILKWPRFREPKVDLQDLLKLE